MLDGVGARLPRREDDVLDFRALELDTARATRASRRARASMEPRSAGSRSSSGRGATGSMRAARSAMSSPRSSVSDDVLEDVLEQPVWVLRRCCHGVLQSLAAPRRSIGRDARSGRPCRGRRRFPAGARASPAGTSARMPVPSGRPRAYSISSTRPSGYATTGGGWPADDRRQTPVSGSSAEIRERREGRVEHLVGEPVEPYEHGRRLQSVDREGADRVAQLRHARGCLDALPDDVADHESELPVGKLERVEPVAARRRARRCPGR